MSKEFIPLRPSERVISRRKWVAESRFVNALFPLQVFDYHDGLGQAAEAVSRGRGLDAFFGPHPGIRDALDIGRLVVSKPEIRSSPVLAAIAKHQYDVGALRTLSSFFGVELRPVVTNRTRERQPDRYSRNDVAGMLQAFVSDLAVTLDYGGVCYETIYADRQATLIAPQQRPVELAVKKSMEAGVSDFGLVFVYLHVPDAGEEIRGLKFGQPYEAWVGRYYTADEAVDRAGGVRNLDAWAYARILELAREAEQA